MPSLSVLLTQIYHRIHDILNTYNISELVHNGKKLLLLPDMDSKVEYDIPFCMDERSLSALE